MCHSHSVEVNMKREKQKRDTLGNKEEEEDTPVV